MIEIPDEKQIYVSGRIWHELYPKVNPSPFLYALYEHIDLSKYGDGVKKFFFTFIVVRPENNLNKPGTYFSQKKREAEIAVKIPFEVAEAATKEVVIKLMENAYLEGIDLITTLPLKSSFDVAAFKKDVAAIFAQDRWYERAVS